jgi:PemK-like, MazF-like toxin of type II toxin-antitoxin system
MWLPSKSRPALVVSNSTFNLTQRNSVLAMITSADQTDWLGDCAIVDFKIAGGTFWYFKVENRLVLGTSTSIFTEN